MITDKSFGAHCAALDDTLPPECSFFLVVFEAVPVVLPVLGSGYQIDLRVGGSDLPDPRLKAALATALRELASDLDADARASDEPA